MSHIRCRYTPSGSPVCTCEICGATNTMSPSAFEKAHAHERYGAGDGVAAITKLVGIQPCAPCKKRQQLLNRLFPNIGPKR